MTAFQLALLVLLLLAALAIWLIPSFERLVEKYMKTDGWFLLLMLTAGKNSAQIESDSLL